MEQVAIKPPNSSHSAGKLMRQNYINVQAKENYEIGIDNIGTVSLFDRKTVKKISQKTSYFSKGGFATGNIDRSRLCIFSYIIPFFILSSSILKST